MFTSKAKRVTFVTRNRTKILSIACKNSGNDPGTFLFFLFSGTFGCQLEIAKAVERPVKEYAQESTELIRLYYTYIIKKYM